MKTNATQSKGFAGQNAANSGFTAIAHAKKLENATKLILTTLFMLLFAGFVYWFARQSGGFAKFHPSYFDLALLGLAVMRLGRLVAFSQVMEPLRAPFVETVPDESGAGENVVARGSGLRQALGQMISCPICAGTWIAAGLTYGLYTFPDPTRLFLFMNAGIGIAELLHSLTETLSWSGSQARIQTGKTLRSIKEEHLIAKENESE
ncbi:MAG: DUF1360 domain-containing protein [Chloroflexota bacterium]